MRIRLVFVFFSFQWLLTACGTAIEKTAATPQMLEGVWKSAANIVFYEQWEILNDSLVQGVGFGLNQQDTIITERMKMAVHDGTWHFFALVTGQNSGKEIAFRKVECEPDRLVFENPDHDYPNRISYIFHADTSLTARIENMRGNKQKEFTMKRISKKQK